MPVELIIALLAAAVQSGTPILYATLGEMVTERSGVLNLGVEGMMLFGALAAFWFSLVTGQPWLGFLMGGVCAALLASVHGLVCLGFQGNQVVSGLALTILGTGLANYLGTPLVGTQGVGFSSLSIPGLSSIPVIGPIFFSHDILVYISFVLPLLVWLFLKHTRLGLHLRSVGENPSAAATAGLNVVGLRWLGITMGGFLVGLGGAYLSLAYIHMWTNGLTAGRGWIAVALVIFSFWRPGRAVFGAYLFGGVMAFQLRLQAMGTDIPSSFLLMLPYGLTILVLILSTMIGRGSAAPAALAVNVPPEE